jgi:hypothetical protein
MTTDTNKPVIDALPTSEEVDAFVAGLNETDREELRRQRLVNAALARTTPKAPDLGRMSNQEWENYKRSIGI